MEENYILQIPEKNKKIEWKAVFGNENPVKVEIGPGKGDFLLAVAEKEPENNFVAIEVRNKRVVKIHEKILKAKMRNIRIAEGFGQVIIDNFPDESVSAFFVHFPDPWPKRHHEKHRLIRPEIIRHFHKLLHRDGKIYLTTDDEPYAIRMRDSFAGDSGFKTDYSDCGESEHPYHHTIHERKFKILGRKIFYFCFSKLPDTPRV